MKIKRIKLLLFFIVCLQAAGHPQQVVKQGGAVPGDFCISQAEMKLCRMVNEFRKRNNLPPVPLSRSLSFVAVMHAKDLFLNKPDKAPCNFHSWSNKGPWKPFCYPRDENKKNSVWDKPRELTRYPAKGYEIIYWENSPATIDSIMSVWRTEDSFSSFLLCNGKWQGKKWNAMGIGIYENYACAWFGEAADPEGPVTVCGSITPPPPPATPPPLASDDSVKHKKTAKPTKHVREQVKEQGKEQVKVPDSLPHKKPELTIEPSSTSTGTYYIIIKSNLPMEIGKKMIPGLISSGYPAAKVLEKEGKARIAVFETPNKAEAMNKLKEVKKTHKDAWLLKN